MKNVSGAEQFNQFKMNRGIDTIWHENHNEGRGEDKGRVISGESQMWAALREEFSLQIQHLQQVMSIFFISCLVFSLVQRISGP